MSENDVIEQVSNYGAFLERATRQPLTSGEEWPVFEAIASNGAVDFDVPTEVGHEQQTISQGSRVRVLLTAVAVVALVGGAAALIDDQSPGSSVVGSAIDLPGPLFVLPNAASELNITAGYISRGELPDAQEVAQTAVVAVIRGDGYQEITSVLISTTQSPDDHDGGWEDIALGDGDGQVSQGFFTAVTKQRAGRWITVTSGPDTVGELVQTIDHLSIGSDGLLALDPSTGLEIIESTIGLSRELDSTSFEVISDSSPGAITVETASTTAPLFGAALFGGEIHEVSFRGGLGWQLNRRDADGESHSLVWQATPSRIIAVSGRGPIEEIVRIAESLIIVDEETWQRALPDFTIDSLTFATGTTP